MKMRASGVSQRQAAKLLGVGVATINRDVSQDGTESVPKRNNDSAADVRGEESPPARTGSAETKAHRAALQSFSSAIRVFVARLQSSSSNAACRSDRRRIGWGCPQPQCGPILD